MVRKCLLMIILVDEANEESPEKIEEEIWNEADVFLRLIPWAKEIEKVTIFRSFILKD